MIDRPSEIMSIVNETITDEIICKSEGKGLVKPEISWVGHGKRINPEEMNIQSWEVKKF